MSSDWPVASALLAGRYRLVSLLETGGMAEIWQAEDELLDRPVAVKLPKGPQVVWREARMAAKLSHPGIAAVHDYREAVRPDGTVVPFVVMELLTGESVAARVDRELVGWAEAARVGAAVADALAAAHASGVVHRDIKPGNVMLTPNGVKILDFGISVAAGEPDDDDTGATFGTPAYVAPERLDGMPAEPATDVYGVGVLLFEMVTGDPPYPVETWEELAVARVAGPSELPGSLPADFRDVVARCLDADPGRRPTAARLRADLLAVALRSRPSPAGSPARPAKAATPAPDVAADLPRPADGSVGELVGAVQAPATARPDRPLAPSERAEHHTGRSAPRAAFVLPDGTETRRPAATRNFATGRVSPATVEMTPAPRRRAAVGVGAAAVLAALIGTLTVVTWTQRNTGDDTAAPPPASVPVLPEATLTSLKPRPSSASPAPARTSGKPTTLTFAEAVGRMRDAVEGGAASGQIRPDVAEDLLNLIRPLAKAPGPDVPGQVDTLRRKIQTRVGEGGVTPARATVLRSRLADLDRAAGT